MGGVEMADLITLPRATVQQALEAPGCERLREWASIGPVQRAAVESFLHAALEQPEQAEVLAWMYVAAHEPRNRHLEWTEDRKGYRGDWIKTPLVAAPAPRQSSDAATPCRPGAPASPAGPGST